MYICNSCLGLGPDSKPNTPKVWSDDLDCWVGDPPAGYGIRQHPGNELVEVASTEGDIVTFNTRSFVWRSECYCVEEN